jgi:hypothetical protein
MVIKYLYVLFIGLLFALFIGIGISTFYERPPQPDTRPIYAPEKYGDTTGSNSAEIRKTEIENERLYKEYDKKIKVYSRNVSIIAIVFAILALITSLTFIKKIQIISDGLLTGGIFTLIYSIIMGIESADNKFRFAVITIGFVISLIIGYIKFVRPLKTTT